MIDGESSKAELLQSRKQGYCRVWRSMKFDLSIFHVWKSMEKIFVYQIIFHSSCLVFLLWSSNEFIVHFFIMQNAGYKPFGFSTILHRLKDLYKNRIKIGPLQKQKKRSIYDNAHNAIRPFLGVVSVLAAAHYALKRPKALKYGILPQWKPNLKHFFTVPVRAGRYGQKFISLYFFGQFSKYGEYIYIYLGIFAFVYFFFYLYLIYIFYILPNETIDIKGYENTNEVNVMM